MGRRFIVCIFALVAFSTSAAHGVHGGHNGQSVSAGADGGNGSNGGDIDNSSGPLAAPIPISTVIFISLAPANPAILGPRMQRKSGLPASVQLRSCSALSSGGES